MMGLNLVDGFGVVGYALCMPKSKRKMPAIARRWLYSLGAISSLLAGMIGSLFGGGAGPLYVMYRISRRSHLNAMCFAPASR